MKRLIQYFSDLYVRYQAKQIARSQQLDTVEAQILESAMVYINQHKRK